MARLQDIDIPHLEFAEAAAPATPAASIVRIYAKTDGLLYSKDDAGTETLLSGGAGVGLSDATPIVESGSGSAGTGTSASRDDHVHPAAAGGTSYPYFSRRIVAQMANTDSTLVVDNASYTGKGNLRFTHDWDAFPATHFMITCYGASSEAGQTVSMQLTAQATPATPYSAAGNDLVVTNTAQNWSSGWVAITASPTGILEMHIAVKGSNATVDFAGRFIDIAFKIA